MRKTRYLDRLRLAVGWVTLFTVGTDLFVVSPLLPTLAHRDAVTPSTAGWMVSAFSLMYAASAPWWGARADANGKRPIIVLGLVGFSAGNCSRVASWPAFQPLRSCPPCTPLRGTSRQAQSGGARCR